MNIFEWMKSKFDKIKESIQNSKKTRMNNRKFELGSPEDRYQKIVDYFKDSTNQRGEEPKSWELTPEQQEMVEEGYQEIRIASNQAAKEDQDIEPDQLNEEDLDKVMYWPNGIAPRYDLSENTANVDDKFDGR